MRKVFTNRMVAHVWAQQTKDSGRSGNSNFYFSGPTIFSYDRHFPIARFTTNARGDQCVLFTTDTAGVSTTRHIRYTRGALRGLACSVWDVPLVLSQCSNGEPNAETHQYNAEALAKEYAEFAAELAKPRKRFWCGEHDGNTAQGRCDALADRARYVADYCAAFAVPVPESPKLAEWQQAIRAAFEKYNDPKAVAKRERDYQKRKVQRESAKAETYQRFHAFMEGVHPFLTIDDYKRLGYRDQYDYRRRARDIQDTQRRPDRKTITAEQWRNGVNGSLDYYANTLTLVRRKGDKLETSRGAECPWSHAVVAFLKAMECRRTGAGWHRNGQQIRVGHFNVDSIDNLGNIRAGCHTLQYEEMLGLAVREVPHLVNATFTLPVAASSWLQDAAYVRSSATEDMEFD